MRIVVIGAGVVGLACARALVHDGHAVRVVERALAGDRTSFGNAGGLAVSEIAPASAPGLWKNVPRWLVDPLGPLSIRPGHALRLLPWLRRFLASGTPAEIARISAANAALNRRVYDDILPLLADVGLSGDLRRDGALTLYESEEGFEAERTDWERRAAHGFPHEVLSREEARAMEPALSPRIARAVFDPAWGIVADPRRIVEGLEAWLRAKEVAFHEAEAVAIEPKLDRVSVALGDGTTGDADLVVVAAGAWSARLAASVGDPVLLESERGYNVTIPRPNIALARQLVFAERKFVATPLAPGLRIGGAAEFAGLDAPARLDRADALARLARVYLRDLDTRGGTRWMGQRPSTPDGLPVIGWSPGKGRVIYAFGHGHLGLTQAATTGRLVAGLLTGDTAGVDMTPYAISRFAR
ncbi:NAD(P)/FAD-dependent oxidoreductase [Salinarimonas rosea]|uniref:NAD(P)/FAD-dependent oxidoreductase n=1 Tax=Salinarimonas rosea TaxID=552063 RepID=UPI0004026F03|nr:FAD-dependent oxidoreductase [Salinarimonas rosea]